MSAIVAATSIDTSCVNGYSELTNMTPISAIVPVVRVIRYNRSPESTRERSESQRARVHPEKPCRTCLTVFQPHHQAVKDCPTCRIADPFYNATRRRRRARGHP